MLLLLQRLLVDLCVCLCVCVDMSKRVAGERPAAELRVSFGDVVLEPADMAILDSPREWLNDQCIAFAFEVLQASAAAAAPAPNPPAGPALVPDVVCEAVADGRLALVSPSTVKLIELLAASPDDLAAMLAPLGLANCRLALFPINDHTVGGGGRGILTWVWECCVFFWDGSIGFG